MKNYLLSSVFAAILPFTATTASAYPIGHQADFSCPVITAVANFSDYVAGYGSEAILGHTHPIYFRTVLWPSGVPSNLSSYTNSGTNYDSTTALVYCHYSSNADTEQPFDLTYYVTNGRGGLIQSQTNNAISVLLPLGLHA